MRLKRRENIDQYSPFLKSKTPDKPISCFHLDGVPGQAVSLQEICKIWSCRPLSLRLSWTDLKVSTYTHETRVPRDLTGLWALLCKSQPTVIRNGCNCVAVQACCMFLFRINSLCILMLYSIWFKREKEAYQRSKEKLKRTVMSEVER